MADPVIIAGSYSDLKFVRTRQVAQVIVEIPLSSADMFVKLFGAPNPAAEVPIAIARLETVKSGPKLTAADKRTWDEMPMVQQAALRCGEPAFWRFLAEEIERAPVIGQAMAADIVRKACGVTSRKHLAESQAASAKWVELDTRFQVWMRAA